jgi:hypothetical protein
MVAPERAAGATWQRALQDSAGALGNEAKRLHCGAEQGDHWSAHGSCDVHQPGVVGDNDERTTK